MSHSTAVRGSFTVAAATLLLGLCHGPEADSRRPDERRPADRAEPGSDGGTASSGPGTVQTRSLSWSTSAVGEQRAIVMLPRGVAEGTRLPLLVALHGQGEARRGVRRGAWGWVRDYDLGRADAALRRGVLTLDDFQGFVDASRLQALNDSLRARPYRGLVVACPYTNDLFADRDVVAPFDRFVVDELLPRVRREMPAASERGATGIDGVSLGGIQALLVGLAHPELFGAVGGMQPAIRRYLAELLERARRGGSERPAQRLRLVTSTGDHFRDVVLRFSGQLRAASITHEVLVVPGPHDYVWNRGPGSVEMLLWYDRTLRGEDP